MTRISVDDVWKEFGDRIVLERISIDFAPRSFNALVGPSGCGKTTLLRMLLSQEAPTRGTITLDGAPIPREATPDRGVVFQRYSVFPHLTALGNVMLGRELESAPVGGRLWGSARRRVRDEALALLAEVGLAEAADRYPSELSGGMQQRLAIAQTLFRRPRVLLLDEPFGALDPGVRAEIRALVRRLWNEADLTVVMVTHDLSEAFSLATRVVVLERLRDGPQDRERYGATITHDIEVWPRRVAGQVPNDGEAHA